MFTIIPAIDIIDGACVRLTQGDYAQQTTYSNKPLEIARQWAKQGARRIHLVDLDGAKNGQAVNAALIKKIASSTNCEIEIGGGIRTMAAITDYLENGIDYVILGSIIFQDKELLKKALEKYPGRIIAGVDLENGKPKIAGWLKEAPENGLAVFQELEKIGFQTAVSTDISKDGMLAGPNTSLYTAIAQHTSLHIIASGGITTLADIKAVKNIPQVTGCIIGKALYENRLQLEDALTLEE